MLAELQGKCFESTDFVNSVMISRFSRKAEDRQEELNGTPNK
jgi:hypothetical protein